MPDLGQEPSRGRVHLHVHASGQVIKTATMIYREMDMQYWLEQAEAEMRELG
jgi:hypothetical protein